MNHITRTLLHLTMASTLAAGGCAPAGAAESTGVPAPATQPARSASSWEWVEDNPASGPRRYRLFIPAAYTPSRPAPLVVMLHGCTQDPDDFARGTRFNQLADSAGVIVVYPEQSALRNPQKCWNWYQELGAGEPAWIEQVTRQVMGRYRVDPLRVHIAGVSAGGAMAVNTAAAHPTLYASVGVHSGIPYGAARDLATALAAMRSGPANDGALADSARAVLRSAGRDWLPMIVFHGAADAVVNRENGRRLALQWAVAGGAKDFLRSEEQIGGLNVVKDRFGPAVELWMVEGLGHAWSGGSPEGTYTDARGPDASREMLRFFLSHPRD
jgi:poly(hydroxyalkanoate) depolymerase family esterase